MKEIYFGIDESGSANPRFRYGRPFVIVLAHSFNSNDIVRKVTEKRRYFDRELVETPFIFCAAAGEVNYNNYLFMLRELLSAGYRRFIHNGERVSVFLDHLPFSIRKRMSPRLQQKLELRQGDELTFGSDATCPIINRADQLANIVACYRSTNGKYRQRTETWLKLCPKLEDILYNSEINIR